MKKKYRAIALIIPGIILVIVLSVSLVALKQKSTSLDPGKTDQGSSVIEPAVAIGPPQKARGYRASSMSLSAGLQRVPIDTESYDSSNILDTSTGRITPTEPGYYQVDGQLNGSLLGRTFAYISKNGAEAARGTDITLTVSTEICNRVSDVIYLNGTSDYVELGIYVSSASSLSSGSGKFWKNYLSLVGPL